jgi:hypothetical protein
MTVSVACQSAVAEEIIGWPAIEADIKSMKCVSLFWLAYAAGILVAG